MADVTDIKEHLEYMFFEAMCIQCQHRWIATERANILLKNLKCPNCLDQGHSINTGQNMVE